MFDRFIVAIAARLRLKKLLWPSVGDPKFIEKFTRKQQHSSSLPPARLVRDLAVKSQDINGYNCVTIAPERPTDAGVIMYIHGGAFVLPINNLHWRIIADLARETGRAVVVPLYPFVPSHNYVDIQAQLMAAYEVVLEMVEPADASVVGDSAGGNLALSLLQLVAGDKQPGNVIVLSPVVDLQASNPAIDRLESSDPLLPLGAIRHLLPRYYAGTSPTDPLISPLFADFTGIRSNLYILSSGKDLLSPDIELFHQALLRQKVQHRYVYEEHMPHAWPIFPLRHSKRTRTQIARWCIASELER